MPIKENESVENENILTEQEKLKLITEHNRYIDDFNSHLPDNLKIPRDDEAFMQRLNDPEEVARYKRSLYREEKLRKQTDIYAKLEAKYGKAPENRNYLNRNIKFAFKTDGTDESNEYNEKLYKGYVENPEKLLHNKLKNIMEADPQQFYDAIDDKGKLCDFYDFNQEVVEDAFVIKTVLKDDALNWVNPQFKNAINSMTKPIESLGLAQREAYASVGSAYLTMPKITTEQAVILSASGPQYTGNDADMAVRNTIMNAMWKDPSVEQPKDYYDKLTQQGMNLNKDFFISHAGLERQADGSYKEVSFDEPLNHPNDANLSIQKRTKDEIWHLKNISKEYEREYLSLWQKKYENVSGEGFNFARIKENNKGNIFERTFRRTSREYKEFIKQFENFNNPESKDYLNRDKLREKADAYEQHKIAQGRTYEQMDTTSKGRMDLVHNVKETLNYMDKADDVVRNKIENKLYADEENRKSIGESFLNLEDLNESNSIDNANEKDSLNNDILNFLHNTNINKQQENENDLGSDDNIGELDELSM